MKKPDSEQRTENAPPTDQSGKPVDVVERDLQEQDDETDGVDKTITPTSVKTKEQDAEAINRKAFEAERKMTDQQ